MYLKYFFSSHKENYLLYYYFSLLKYPSFQSQLIQMQQLSQEQEEIKEQQKVLMQQQERILKEQDALRQREVFIRKIFYDASANMAVADHMVSAMINQSHVMSSPLVRSTCMAMFSPYRVLNIL